MHSKRRSAALAVAALTAASMVVAAPSAGAAGATATETSPFQAGARLELVASGLGTVVDIAAPPGDDRLFVVDKSGRIRIVDDGQTLPTPFLDISGPVDTSGGERGLLGLAFDPDYASNGRFYVNYTAESGGGDSTVARYTVSSGDPNRAATGGTVLLTQDQPYSNHNGGDIGFGPDGYLYASFGDGGSGGDPQDNAQNTGNLLGTIVRIDPDDGSAAPGNPFIGGPGDDRIWAYGLRNPWRFDFDEATGDIIVGDVGQDRWEEVDRIPAGVGGLNFGWDDLEGDHCFEPPSGCDRSGKTPPIHEYAHGSDPCSGSITGGVVYRGNDLPHLRGTYFYADYCKNFLKSFRISAGGNAVEHRTWTSALGAPGNILTFGEDGFGEMYLASGSSVYKLVPDGAADCDFDGDGRGDLPVGVPGESHGGAARAGLVQVFDGASTGLVDVAGDQTVKIGNPLAGSAERNDRLGDAVACGDFDGDGYRDLAIGAPRRDVSGKNAAGEVRVMYGSAAGLRAAGAQTWNQDTAGVPGKAQTGDRFGAALAAGDFNRDGYADLAVGVPRENIDGAADAGAVNVFYGASSGLTTAGAENVHQNKKGIKTKAEAAERFGGSLVAADVDGDGHADLVAGVTGEDVDGVDDAGAVHVVFGNGSGLSRRDAVVHRAADGTGFGSALGAGHLDLDGFDDVVVGFTGSSGGEAVALFGGPDGLDGRDRSFVPGSGLPALSGVSEFASSIAVGDFDGNHIDGVVFGVPSASVGGKQDAGAVMIVYSGVSGPRTSSAQVMHRDSPGVKATAKALDRLGTSVAALDLNGDGRAELVAGVLGADRSGELTILRGRRSGFNGKGDVRLAQGRNGANGTAETGDRFGAAL